MTLGDAWTCAECAHLQQFDPLALCKPHSDQYRAPLAWAEEHLHTGPERAEDTGETEGE